MILPPEKLNDLHLLFQNLVVADQTDSDHDFDIGTISLIVGLLGIYLERLRNKNQ